MDKNVKLELTIDNLNVVLAGLSKLPLEISMATFMEVRKQAETQLDQQKPEGPLASKVVN